MITPEQVKDLEKFVSQQLTKNPLPIVKGNTIFLGNIIIRKSATGYSVIDRKENISVIKTFSKRAALAAAKTYINNKSIEHIVNLDKKYQKYYNDCVFYKYGIDKTSSDNKKDVLETRLECAEIDLTFIKNNLDRLILF